MGPPAALPPLADRPSRRSERRGLIDLRGHGQLMDEHPIRLQAGRRPARVGRSTVGGVQSLDPDRDDPHARICIRRHGICGRGRLCGRNAAWSWRRLPSPRPPSGHGDGCCRHRAGWDHRRQQCALHVRRTAGEVRGHGSPVRDHSGSSTAHRRHPERLSRTPPLRDRDTVRAEPPGRVRSKRRGSWPRFVSGRPAPEHGRGAPVVRHDGRARHWSRLARRVVLAFGLARATGANESSFTLGPRRGRAGRGDHHGGGLVRHRIWTSAVDRLWNHPHHGRRHLGSRARPRLRCFRRHLHRPGGHAFQAAAASRASQPRAIRAEAMSEADAAAGLLWLSLTAYAVLAGADFGGGVWDIFASGPRKRAQRQAVARAMGPVWEANHVWLIFMITGLFTTFPIAFGYLSLALYVPMTIALVGIVLRGAAFAFRAHGREAVGPLSPWGVVFGGSSIVAPFFLGTAAAAVASGAIRITGGRVGSGFGAGWSTPFALVMGLLAVALCAYLAAAYLMVETEDDPALQLDFRRRALVASVVSGALALFGLWLAYAQAPRVWADLTGNGLLLLLLALINGPIALWGVWRLRPRLTRIAVAAQVTLVLWAWAVGQWPYLVPPDLTIADAAAPAAVLSAWLVVIVVGMALVIPSLGVLFRVFKARNPAA